MTTEATTRPVLWDVRSHWGRDFDNYAEIALTNLLLESLELKAPINIIDRPEVFRLEENKGEEYDMGELVEVGLRQDLWITTRLCHIGSKELASAVLLLL